MISAIIIDDEPLARRRILRFLRTHKDVKVIRECNEGRSALAAILNEKPDLVFLDMHLPEISGLEIISAVDEAKMPGVIFITAHEHYALSAFEANAVDYILKPFGQERFDKALDKVKRRLNSASGGITSAQLAEIVARIKEPPQYRDRLPVMVNDRIVLVKAKDIHWIEAEGNNARLHTKKETLDIRGTLISIEKKLDPNHFIRIHRSTIVNVEKIQEILPWFNGYHLVILEDGKELRMSRYQMESAKCLLGH